MFELAIENHFVTGCKIVGIGLLSIVGSLAIDPSTLSQDIMLAGVIFIAGTAISNALTIANIRTDVGHVDNKLENMKNVMNLNIGIENRCKHRPDKLEMIE